MPDLVDSLAKLIDIYRTRHNISASTEAAKEPDALDDDLVNAWAANLGDDGLWGKNAPAMSRVNEFLAGAGTDAPDVEEEHYTSRPSVSYDDMWAKTLLEPSEMEEEDARSYGSSSPKSTGSVETSMSSHFGGMNYPSLFSSKPSGLSLQHSDRSSGPAASRFSSPSYSTPSIYESPVSPVSGHTLSYKSSLHIMIKPKLIAFNLHKCSG
ncbi:uncharacterized protein LOC113306148 [Papaver somniferum]|uniref:uncharacterized protein LOC113306148 n=1 Tax=Papaver somniferum TaxID=3469 RepID=UPI000E7007A9|nr:uncharacterized protein LOC113306148 [Papaver somniferum]